MKKKESGVINRTDNTSRNKNSDTLVEEYMSKLEQKFVTQSQQLKTITDNAVSCLFMIDVRGKPIFMNPSAEKTTGYSLEEIKGKTLHNVIHQTHPDGSPNPAIACPIILALRKMQLVKDHEDMFIRKDGSLFPVSFSVAPLKQNGKLQGAVLEFQDITKRKELERQKDDFIGVASHELKTPVTSIKSYIQVLKKQFENRGEVKTAANLGKIDTQINKLTSLIADLLDVTQTQSGNLSLHQETFDLDTLVREVVENMQLTTERHTIIVKHKAETKITADRDRTGQVLINFLSNAIKYSPNGKKIIVSASKKKHEIVVSVQDFGIGIPTKKLGLIFERFMRVTGPARETFGGLGLGLFISSQIIGRQGGRIWVKSKVNRGSTFFFSLPKTGNKIG